VQIPATLDRQPIRLAAVTTAPALREELRRVLRDPGYVLGLEITEPLGEIGKEQLARLRQFRPEALILDLGADPVVGIRFAQFLVEGDPALRIIAIGPTLSPELLLEAMRAGITEYLQAATGEEELNEALGRVARKLRRGGAEEREPGKIFSFFSAKGGAGSTIAATNLAVELQRQTGKRTLLIDLDLELGEVALLLGMQPRFSFLDLVKNLHRMDANLLASYIERHYSGVGLLAAPAQLEPGASPTREEVRSVLNLLKRHYDYIVVDTAKSLSPGTRAAIEVADLVLLLTTAELPALRNAKRCLPFLMGRENGQGRDPQLQPDQQGSKEPKGKVRLLVNRYSPEGLISLDDIRRTLELEVYWSLSSDYQAISHSITRGEPIALNGNSRYVRELRALGADLAGVTANASSRGGGPLAGLTAPLQAAWRRIFQPSSGA
jgi:pilus assembly protein CpaE